MDLQVLEIRNSDDLDRTLRSGGQGPPGALVQLSSPTFELHAGQIAEFTLRRRVPAISMSSRFTDAGGLMAYGPSRPEFGRRLAVLIDKILKGASPGELPIEQPTKFELIVNLRAARALGLALPPSLLARADRVIQ